MRERHLACRVAANAAGAAREPAGLSGAHHAQPLHQPLPPPELPASLRAFLGRITRNLSISRYRQNRAQKRYAGLDALLSELDDCVPSPVTVEQTLDAMELTRQIEAWLGALPERERRLFLRRYWYGEALSELAAQEGTKPAQLAQLMLRLRRSLRKHLEADGAAI